MREASTRSVDMYIASVRDRLRSTHVRGTAPINHGSMPIEMVLQQKIGAMNLKPGDLVLVKADAWKGKRKIKDRCEEETWEVVCQIVADIPSYEVMNQHGWSQVLPPKPASSCCIRGWCSRVYGQPSYMGQVYQPNPMQDYLC